MSLKWLPLLIAPALLAIACGGEGSSPTASPEPSSAVAQPSPTAEPTPTLDDKESPTPQQTGIAELDVIIHGFVEHDTKRLLPLLRYQTLPCTAEPQGIGGPPLCRPDQQDGTPTEVMPYSTCELELKRPHEFEETLVRLVEQDLYGVYSSTPEVQFPGDYVVVLSTPLSTDGDAGTEVVIEDGRIVGADLSCILSPEELVETHSLGEPLFRPDGQ